MFNNAREVFSSSLGRPVQMIPVEDLSKLTVCKFRLFSSSKQEAILKTANKKYLKYKKP